VSINTNNAIYRVTPVLLQTQNRHLRRRRPLDHGQRDRRLGCSADAFRHMG